MPLAFMQLEITSGIILIVALASMIPFHILTVHYRQFAPLRDVQPTLCMLTHIGYFMFIVHLFFAWKHQVELCYELAVVQLVGCVLLYGCFACKHYALHRRYRVVTSQLPTHIVFVLAAFPFLLLSTYRVATRQEDLCPNVDGVAGACGFLIWAITLFFFMLQEHPSSHFVRAKNMESVAILVTVATCVVHQWVDIGWVILTLLFVNAVAANASFLAYVLPPIRLALQHGNEFTDEQQRILNDSVFGASSPTGYSDDHRESCMDRCAGVIVNCFRSILVSEDKDASIGNGSIASGPAGTPVGTRSGGGVESNTNSGPLASRDRMASPSPAKQRQEAETQQELKELIGMIQQGDFYRLQKVMTRRGVALINLGDEHGRTPLHHAVRVGDLNCIRFLLAMGADTNQFDFKGRAPLHEAVRAKTSGDRSSVITELLRCGAGVNLPTSQGQTALHFAVQGGLLGAVNTLLRHDANPWQFHDKEDATLSWQQAHVSNCQVYGNDICKKSALTIAVEMGSDKVVSSMLHSLKLSKTRLNTDVRCIHGMTLLHIALCLGNSNVVQVLLFEGSCSPWTINEETGMNCFHMAAIGDSALSVATILAHIGAPDLIPEDSEFSEVGMELPITASAPPAGLRTLGTGIEHASLQPNASSSSVPASPAERPHRVDSYFSSAHSKKVQYGCCAPMFGAVPQCMGFGEAMSILREHLPNATAELSKMDDLEATVDRVVAHLKTKSNITEVERVQCAMVVVAKRLRSASTRSLAALASSQSFPGVPSTSSIGLSARPTESNIMKTIQGMLRRPDNVGMTPLHYAIQQQNINLVHIFSAYGAIAADDELPPSRGSNESPTTSEINGSFSNGNFMSLGLGVMNGGGTPPEAFARAAGGSPVMPGVGPGAARSPPCPDEGGGLLSNDTQAFIGSLQRSAAAKQNTGPANKDGAELEEISFRSYSRDARRYVDDEGTQDLLLRTMRDGLSIQSRYRVSSMDE